MHEPEIATTIRRLADAASPSMPNPALWSHIVAARERTLRARRRRRAAVGTSACAIALACCVAWLLPNGVSNPAAPSLAGQQESQALEAEWRSIAPQVNPDPVALMPLRVVDAALQSAYERHAATDELGSLWAERNRTLRALINHHDAGGDHAPFAVTRI